MFGVFGGRAWLDQKDNSHETWQVGKFFLEDRDARSCWAHVSIRSHTEKAGLRRKVWQRFDLYPAEYGLLSTVISGDHFLLCKLLCFSSK